MPDTPPITSSVTQSITSTACPHLSLSLSPFCSCLPFSPVSRHIVAAVPLYKCRSRCCFIRMSLRQPPSASADSSLVSVTSSAAASVIVTFSSRYQPVRLGNKPRSGTIVLPPVLDTFLVSIRVSPVLSGRIVANRVTEPSGTYCYWFLTKLPVLGDTAISSRFTKVLAS